MAKESKSFGDVARVPQQGEFTSKILYHGNLSKETVTEMKEFRKLCYAVAERMDQMEGSAELTIAFRHLQKCLMFVNAHLCYTDEQAVKESLE